MVVIELVGFADIAKIAGVSRSTPGIWFKRFPDAPQPLATVNQTTQVFNRAEVEGWLRKNGRLKLDEGVLYDARTGKEKKRLVKA